MGEAGMRGRAHRVRRAGCNWNGRGSSGSGQDEQTGARELRKYALLRAFVVVISAVRAVFVITLIKLDDCL